LTNLAPMLPDPNGDPLDLDHNVAGAKVFGTSLLLVGTDARDRVSVRQLRDGMLKVTSATLLPGGPQLFDPTGFNQIEVHAHSGNDNVRFAPNVTMQSLIDGGAGKDRLKAGSGDDVVIGGSGADVVAGGKGENIVLDGTTNLDRLSLVDILAEWNSPRTFADRANNISGIGGPPLLNPASFLQDGVSVFNDGDKDRIGDRPATNWFFADVLEDVLKGGGILTDAQTVV
ncbi:MAG: hypothetical protein OER86_07865, partial [Phycisphaerae bacterium]|nr:hypothetical protein [Phycisphaerae bacterium]